MQAPSQRHNEQSFAALGAVQLTANLACEIVGIPGSWVSRFARFRDVETIARGSRIRKLARLRKPHGTGNRRKRKDVATVTRSGGQSEY